MEGPPTDRQRQIPVRDSRNRKGRSLPSILVLILLRVKRVPSESRHTFGSWKSSWCSWKASLRHLAGSVIQSQGSSVDSPIDSPFLHIWHGHPVAPHRFVRSALPNVLVTSAPHREEPKSPTRKEKSVAKEMPFFLSGETSHGHGINKPYRSITPYLTEMAF